MNWRAIPGIELYEVNDVGEIRNAKNKRLKKQRIDSKGRPIVTLVCAGKAIPKLVHRMVAEAFLGPLPKGLETCHYDGNLENSNISNLRYDTKLANEADKKRHGRSNAGERNPNSKINQHIAHLIKAGSESNAHAAAQYGISRKHVKSIRDGLYWRTA